MSDHQTFGSVFPGKLCREARSISVFAMEHPDNLQSLHRIFTTPLKWWQYDGIAEQTYKGGSANTFPDLAQSSCYVREMYCYQNGFEPWIFGPVLDNSLLPCESLGPHYNPYIFPILFTFINKAEPECSTHICLSALHELLRKHKNLPDLSEAEWLQVLNYGGEILHGACEAHKGRFGVYPTLVIPNRDEGIGVHTVKLFEIAGYRHEVIGNVIFFKHCTDSRPYLESPVVNIVNNTFREVVSKPRPRGSSYEYLVKLFMLMAVRWKCGLCSDHEMDDPGHPGEKIKYSIDSNGDYGISVAFADTRGNTRHVTSWGNINGYSYYDYDEV